MQNSDPDQPILEPLAEPLGGSSELISHSEVREDRTGNSAEETQLPGDPSISRYLGEFRSLDPRSIIVERIAGSIFVAILAIALGIYTFVGLLWMLFSPESLPTVYFVVGLIAGVVFIAFLAWTFYVWPARSYRHARWRLTAQGLEIQRGVWWRHHIAIPRERVQHTDVEQGPLMRRYQIAKLVVHTAGTHNSSIELEGLNVDDAQRLRSELTDKRVVRS